MNENYSYDGTLEGMFTVFYLLLKNKNIPKDIKPINDSNIFVDNYIFIQTKDSRSSYLYNYLRNHLDSKIFKKVIISFLSEKSNKELFIYKYILLNLKTQNQADRYIKKEYVDFINSSYHSITSEAHKLTGLIRFKLLKDGFYYASIHPKNDVILLLYPHFSKRFNTFRWMIHDMNRSKILIFNGESSQIHFVKEFDKRTLESYYDSEELYFQQLWKEYHKNMEIKERKNKKVQQHFMPLRYWQDLIEDINS